MFTPGPTPGASSSGVEGQNHVGGERLVGSGEGLQGKGGSLQTEHEELWGGCDVCVYNSCCCDGVWLCV